jgi:hypothetical protein
MDFGEDSGADKLHWVEVSAALPAGGGINATWSTGAFSIDEDDYFVLNNKKGGVEGGDEGSFTHILRYTGIDTSENTVTFDDLATGEKEVTFTPNSSAAIDAGVNASGQSELLVVGGNVYKFYVENTTASTRELAIDLNADGTVGNDTVDITILGGGVLDLGESDANDQAFHQFNLTTFASEFDDSSTDENITINLTSSGTELDISFVASPTAGVTSLVSDDSNDDYSRGLSTYGAFIELFDDSTGTSAGELTIEYPMTQRGVDVFVVGTGAAGTTSGSSADVEFTELAGSISKLDTQTTTSDKTSKRLILVGGPAVNNLVVELAAAGKTMTLEEWRTDANVGRAIVQYIGDAWGMPAIVVAGYEAEDTTAAAEALATTALTGTGATWVGTTQSSYMYTPTVAEEATEEAAAEEETA